LSGIILFLIVALKLNFFHPYWPLKGAPIPDIFLTTNSGNYIFQSGVCDVLTNALSSFSQQLVTLAAPTGTNITTIAVTNTLPAPDFPFVETFIWTACQVQPGNLHHLGWKSHGAIGIRFPKRKPNRRTGFCFLHPN
jgi:hypothetical protein